jgi:hypothetical protein
LLVLKELLVLVACLLMTCGAVAEAVAASVMVLTIDEAEALSNSLDSTP